MEQVRKSQRIVFYIWICAIVAGMIVLLNQPGAGGETKPDAIATLHPTEGHQASGVVTFTKTSNGVRIATHLSRLRPGNHGFHIHARGDCSAPDGTSTGGHYNPFDTPHGAPDRDAGLRHVGDLGNIKADADGKAYDEKVDYIVSLGGPESIIGRAVIVHAGEDDFSSQPTGNAGGRIACGVIGYAR